MQTASARRFARQPSASRLRARALHLAGALLMTLGAASVHAQAYRNPLVNTATVTAPTDISDPTPGNNTASDSNALAATSQLSVIKTIVSPAAGVFTPVGDVTPGTVIDVGRVLGHVGDVEVRSPFAGRIENYIAVEGERVTSRQPIAWLRAE